MREKNRKLRWEVEQYYIWICDGDVDIRHVGVHDGVDSTARV